LRGFVACIPTTPPVGFLSVRYMSPDALHLLATTAGWADRRHTVRSARRWGEANLPNVGADQEQGWWWVCCGTSVHPLPALH
jgi:hypothetical protein